MIVEKSEDGTPIIVATALPQNGKVFIQEEKKMIYLQQALYEPGVDRRDQETFELYLSSLTDKEGKVQESGNPKAKEAKVKGVSTGKKYKPVDMKVRPVYGTLPEEFRIVRNITGDPLAGMPQLSPTPPEFSPKGRYTQERMEDFDKAHPDFWWPEERKLMHHLMAEQNEAFAWVESERGKLREDFFPPVKIATRAHEPWVQGNRPIPPYLFDMVCDLMRSKIEAGVYEPSSSSYRSRWFCVLKKDGKSLRIVHSLEPLNAVTIAHSGLPPNTEELASRFAGRSCGTTMDLYVGYDERILDESSRDLTTFQTPFGAMRLVTLPMGWTNSVPIFHEDITAVLQPEIPKVTEPFVDDVPVKGPLTRYELPGGGYETIPENPGIRRFVWEHIQDVNRVIQRMKYCGGTFSGKKTCLCQPEFTVVGHRVSYEGRKPTPDRVGVISRWGPCRDVSDVRAFLGTVGTFRVFIPNYASRAEPIQKLTRKAVTWEWGDAQNKAMDDLKEAVKNSPVLKPLDVTSGQPVRLSVDTSYLAVGWYISQRDAVDPTKWNYIRFGSTLLNSTEANYSQAKRELYGIMRALKENEYTLVMARPLVVETDAKYVQGMLKNPGNAPNATINRWIENIRKFYFELCHVMGKTFPADGLSRRRKMPGDPERREFEEFADTDPPNPITYSKKYPEDDDPLPFEEFRDQIDTRGGYFQAVVHELLFQGIEEEEDAFAKDLEFRSFLNLLEETMRLPEVAEVFAQAIELESDSVQSGADLDSLEYPEHWRTAKAKQLDRWIPAVTSWLSDPAERPKEVSEAEWKAFEKFAVKFFIAKDGRLFRREEGEGHHRLYIEPDRRMTILRGAHDANGHRGNFATRSFIAKRFWWPEMERDAELFVKSCHLCQVRQKTLVRIPPMVTETPSIFQTVHIDTMHMTPTSNGHGYIVHGRCALTSWMEGRPLRKESAATIGAWIFSDIICRWGCLRRIVTDNGKPFIAAVEWLKQKYGITGITISGYNSKANGRIERPHWDVRQSLFKATGGDASKWYWFFDHVMWADRITVRKRLGCSPFFAVTGAEPVTPLDVQEATWLVEPPIGIMSTEDLIAARARALAKHQTHVESVMKRVDAEKRRRVEEFANANKATIKEWNFKRGDLVLVRNTAVESSLNKKMKPRYLGPMVVVTRNRGGAYILAELDGSVSQNKVGAFRVIPYYPRKSIEVGLGSDNGFDTNEATIQELANSNETGNENTIDYSFEGMPRLRLPEDSDDERED